MEPCGAVGVLMNLGGENTGSEILKSLLTSSKMHKTEPVKVNILSDLEPRTQSNDQIVFQIKLGDPIKSEFIPRNENIIQPIPVTYLTADNQNLTHANKETLVEPVTYVLSQDILPNGTRYCTVGNAEPQKIIFMQEEVESNTPQITYNHPEVKSYALKEGQTGDMRCPNDWNVECCSVSNNVKLKENKKSRTENSCGFQSRTGKMDVEKPAEGKDKVEKKISAIKKPLNKRKNSKIKSKLKTVGKAFLKKQKKPLKPTKEEKKTDLEVKESRNLFELTKLEDNVDQVAERLKIGCECSDSNCFEGLKPDDVFKHRLNIADLTKAEHDMYLMGVIMASIHNLEETCRHKERIRIRSCYAYQGKKVCLTAFLYLQHVTLYQMKRLRSHLKNHGVSPRIHGNRGRKPANTFSLDIYRRATNFFQNYIEEHCVKTVPSFTTFSSNVTNVIGASGKQESKTTAKNKIKIANKMTSYHLPPECTKRIVHGEYKAFCESLKPSQKVMKYSTFTSFLKKQFPNVKFHKKEEKKQERVVLVKMEEKWKSATEDAERKPAEDQGVDKCIQVDKTLVYVPKKTQILINGERLEMYDESGAANQVIIDGQNSEQCCPIDRNV